MRALAAASLMLAVMIALSGGASAQAPQFPRATRIPRTIRPAPAATTRSTPCTACHGFRLVAQQGNDPSAMGGFVAMDDRPDGMSPAAGEGSKGRARYLGSHLPPRADGGRGGWPEPIRSALSRISVCGWLRCPLPGGSLRWGDQQYTTTRKIAIGRATPATNGGGKTLAQTIEGFVGKHWTMRKISRSIGRWSRSSRRDISSTSSTLRYSARWAVHPWIEIRVGRRSCRHRQRHHFWHVLGTRAGPVQRPVRPQIH